LYLVLKLQHGFATRETGFSIRVQGSNSESLMCVLDQNRTSDQAHIMSALPPKADIREHDWHVYFVPKAAISMFSAIAAA
jgi:hypothetical protein